MAVQGLFSIALHSTLYELQEERDHNYWANTEQALLKQGT